MKSGSLCFAFLCLLLPAALTGVRAQPAPANDDLANATPVQDATVTAAGSNVGATQEIAEPGSGNIGGKSVWWRWTAPDDGRVEVDTIGSDFDTLLAVFAYDDPAGYWSVANDDDAGGGYASWVTFYATAGSIYLIKVDGHNPGTTQWDGAYVPGTHPLNAQSGNITLRLRMGDASLRITTQPKSQSVVIGRLLQLTVSFTASSPWQLQWWKDNAPIPDGTNALLMSSPASASHSGSYFVTVSNSVGAVTSSVAKVFVAPTTVTAQPQSLTVGSGYDVTLSIRLSPTGSASTLWHKNGAPIEGATNAVLTLTNVQAAAAGVYTVSLSNDVGTALSEPATLGVVTPYTFMTLAGQAGTPGHADGPGNVARFTQPAGIAVDKDGILYVTDLWPNLAIRRITPDGVVTTLAGQPGVTGTNDGVGTAALFIFPEDIVVDDHRNLYVADNFGHTIRKITPGGEGQEWVVSTLAGTPGVRGWQDGPVEQSLFYAPSALALDTAGNLYIAEWGNGAIRRLTPDGMVTTLAGSHKAGIRTPTGIAVDADRNLYVTTVGVAAVIKVTPGGIPSRYGSLPINSYGGSLDAFGNLWVAGNIEQESTLKTVPPEGATAIMAGIQSPGFADGCGSAVRFSAHRSRVATDRFGNVYVTDNDNHVVRKGVPFAVTSPSQACAVPAGTRVDLRAEVLGTESPAYQWARAGQELAQETNAVLSLGPVDRTNSGNYSVLIRNAVGQWISVSTAVNGYHPHRIVSVEVLDEGGRRLLSRDDDGGLPVAPERLNLQWTSTLAPMGGAEWRSAGAAATITNGFLCFEDLLSPAGAVRFYRIEQR
jgi:hypothetical protein